MDRATFDYFARSTKYVDAADQRSGLYPFEERALARFFPPPPARLLAHGVGAGRELLALVAAGYELEAYEPAPRLAAAATQLVAASGVRPPVVGVLSLQQWAAQQEAQGFGQSYAAVFTGWGVWAHLVGQRDRLRVLEALRRACPEGPVLLSFFSGAALFDVAEKPAVRVPLHPRFEAPPLRFTRHTLRERLFGALALERGTGWGRGFFFHLTEEWELREEAASAGYEVAYYERDLSRYPHAVLVPAGARHAANSVR